MYDLAWEAEGVVWVCEVKSLTPNNEEKQLRLGLGQVLRYQEQLSCIVSPSRVVRAVLAVERHPSDESWHVLCRRLNVSLVCGPDYTLDGGLAWSGID